ncbi:TPA: AAA family ATPase [Stenotrophomonas maltophilia]|nr:AAA family ATPase [Stenotrophomonas maltophilia]HEL5043031.1 AAA family ATPase [Stenotrophomonas maltophilia]
MENSRFQELHVYGWRQFHSVHIPVHPRLTVITGANGAGKTTLLGIMAQHFGWERPLLATPQRSEDGTVSYLTGAGYLKGALRELLDMMGGHPPVMMFGQITPIGKIIYSNGVSSVISVPSAGGIQYSINIHAQQSVAGLYIPSHRALSKYQPVGSIPTEGVSASQAYQTYKNEEYNRWSGGGYGASPFFRLKEALIAMATFGEGNAYVRGRPDLLRTYVDFIEVLRKVLPETLGFETISIRTPDVILVTKSGEFLLDAVSGGISSLIDLAWQVHVFSQDKKAFTVVIDEPENHLHPSMQRRLLPSFTEAFPSVQFIVATHSPFIVTSVKDSSVVVLSYKEDMDASDQGIAMERSVRSTSLDQINKAGSADEILRDVLGLESTVPLWAAKELKSVVDRYRGGDFTGDSVDQLSAELDALGLSLKLPVAIESIFSEGKK